MSPTRSGGRFWLVGICVLLSTLGLPALAARPAASTANPTAAPAVDLTGVPADAFGVIVLQPRRLISAPEFKDYPVEILSAMIQKELGVDPSTIEQAVVVTDNLLGPQKPEPGLILHFVPGTALDKAFPQVRSNSSPAEAGGKKYLKPKQAWAEGLYQPDANTIILSHEPLLTRMMNAQQSPSSPLQERAKKLDLSAQLTGVCSLDAVRPSVTELIAHVPQLPPPIIELPRVLTLSSAIEFRLSVNKALRAEVLFHSTDAKEATESARILKSSLEFAQQMLEAKLKMEYLRATDPIEQATGNYAVRTSNRLFSDLKIVPQGPDVSVSLNENAMFLAMGPALLLPAIAKVRAAAATTVSMNNMKQLMLAMIMDEQAQKKYTPRAIVSKDGKPLLSWRVRMLPYLEQEALYKQFHLDEPWDSEHNKPLVAKMPKVFADPEQPQPGKTRYLVPVGEGTIFGKATGTVMHQIVDGTHNTIALVEVGPDKAVEWTKPEEFTVDAEKPASGFGQLADGHSLVAFADGGVQRIDVKNTEAKNLHALFTMAGAESFFPDEIK